MICRHCGKELSYGDKFCKECGKKVKKPAKKDNYTKVGICIILNAIFVALLFTAAAFSAALMPPLLIPIVIVGVVYARILWEKFKKGVGYVPDKENLEKCNRCGSHNIKIYRNGYDYRPGFWGAIFGVRGAGYAGGFDANNACCRCMDCGHDWKTDYDYRLIKK
jgi:DNA-directed RNA polymerase subunit M/transcription elongation factor TFIIS